MELVDTALDIEKTTEIKKFISTIEGVEHMHLLRTRKMGNTVLADVHLQVNAYLSVSEGHFIAENVIQKLRKKFPEMHDITVHIDPEDDETVSPSSHLLSRNVIMEKIYPHIKEAGLDQSIRNIVLHYIDGKIEIEIFLSGLQDESKLTRLKDACNTCDELRAVNIHQQIFTSK